MRGVEPVRNLTVAHSSDLHIDATRVTESFHPLCRVLDTALGVGADLLLLAGDIFDHNRLPLALLDRTARLLADASIPIVILPGNHDCLGHDSVYTRGGLADPQNVYVLGISGESFEFPLFDLEVWGKAHSNHANMSPLAMPQQRTRSRQIAMAHGHWLRNEADRHRAWLITNDDITATGADYVALGHWPQASPAGAGLVPAYYSGSPDLAGTVNTVRFANGSRVQVSRAALTERRS
jgi:DNA repair exonuclease SbcCD nuclease subunit